MGWYYSVSEKVIAVPVGNGEVVGVRPYTHVFIDARSEMRSELRHFLALGLLQRSGNPGRGHVKQVPAQSIASIPIPSSGETAFSDSIVMEAKVSDMKPPDEEVMTSTPESRSAAREKEEEKPEKKTTRRSRTKKSSK